MRSFYRLRVVGLRITAAIFVFSLARLVVAPQEALAEPQKQHKRAHASNATAQDPAAALPDFCDLWMQKLAARERDNITHIKWEHTAGGVEGTYVAYEQEHTCMMADSKEPVGKIHYRELTYKKQGTTIAEAERSTPQVLEVYETTELFRFVGGKWDY